MYFCYFDESGDSGVARSPTSTFVLAGLLVHDRRWTAAFHDIAAFRGYLLDNFDIPSRAELKATWLIRNKGDIRKCGLDFPVRMAAYQAVMRFQRNSGNFRAFAVLVDKNRLQTGISARNFVWQTALNFLQNLGEKEGEDLQIFPDEGHGDFITKTIRDMRQRRHLSVFRNGNAEQKAGNILEDSSDRKSHESYFVQMADLNAYAAFRKIYPGNNADGRLWDALGDCQIKEAGKAGIIVLP